MLHFFIFSFFFYTFYFFFLELFRKVISRHFPRGKRKSIESEEKEERGEGRGPVGVRKGGGGE